MRFSPSIIESVATLCLALGVLQAFCSHALSHWAKKNLKNGSFAAYFFHALSEIELAVGLWALTFIAFFLLIDWRGALHYVATRDMTEPVFVFTIMAVCSASPILMIAQNVLWRLSRCLPMHGPTAYFIVLMIVGPLSGSLITEPAAMTVLALVLFKSYFSQRVSLKFKYSALGLLLVNVSIGGCLTPYSAPPILMVARQWGWGLGSMLRLFGWRGVLSCILSTLLVTLMNQRELKALNSIKPIMAGSTYDMKSVVNLLALTAIAGFSHQPLIFLPALALFVFVQYFKKSLSDVRWYRAVLIMLFLTSLVILGGFQTWWVEPVLAELSHFGLYLGAGLLTAVVDNAVITYLGSQVPNLHEVQKYFLVAGSLVGGGLTVIANAPNPIGIGILADGFGQDGVSPFKVLLASLLPTAVAFLVFSIFVS